MDRESAQVSVDTNSKNQAFQSVTSLSHHQRATVGFVAVQQIHGAKMHGQQMQKQTMQARNKSLSMWKSTQQASSVMGKE